MAFVLHVGLQKTASTYLQQLVFPAASELTLISRPFTQENQAFNALQYADSTLFRPDMLRLEFDRIRAHAGERPIVVSDELLAGFPFYNYLNRTLIAERLAAVVPEAEVVIFLRNQADLIWSLYNQYVKIGWYAGPLDDQFLSAPGEGVTLDEWFEGDRRTVQSRRFIQNRSVCNVEHFRFSILLDLYRRLFAQVHVFLYEDFSDDNATALRRLSEIIDVELPMPEFADVGRNPGLADPELRRAQMANRLDVLVPHSRSRSRPVRLAARALAAVAPDRAEAGRAHIRRLLGAARIGDDNRGVDDAWRLGMHRHREAYFGSV